MQKLSIKVPNVSESLEHRLEAMILGGVFWPDVPLASERKLAEEFGVSRTSLRTALANLCKRGLIVLQGKRHLPTSVTSRELAKKLKPIAQNEPVQLLEYWTVFFAEVSGLARQKARPDDMLRVMAAQRDLRTCVTAQDAKGAMAAFLKLNRVILDGCYNYFLSQTHFAFEGLLAPVFQNLFERVCRDDREAAAFLDVVGLPNPQAGGRAVLFDLLKGDVPPMTGAPQISLDAQFGGDLLAFALEHPRYLDAVYELRLINEKHAAFLAARRGTVDDFRILGAQLERLARALAQAPADYSKLDTELHKLIAETSKNPVFAILDDTLAPIFSSTTNQWLQRHQDMRRDQLEIHVQHTGIVDAIVAGNGEKARHEMIEHLDYVLRGLQRLREQDFLSEMATARQVFGAPK